MHALTISLTFQVLDAFLMATWSPHVSHHDPLSSHFGSWPSACTPAPLPCCGIPALQHDTCSASCSHACQPFRLQAASIPGRITPCPPCDELRLHASGPPWGKIILARNANLNVEGLNVGIMYTPDPAASIKNPGDTRSSAHPGELDTRTGYRD